MRLGACFTMATDASGSLNLPGRTELRGSHFDTAKGQTLMKRLYVSGFRPWLRTAASESAGSINARKVPAWRFLNGRALRIGWLCPNRLTRATKGVLATAVSNLWLP